MYYVAKINGLFISYVYITYISTNICIHIYSTFLSEFPFPVQPLGWSRPSWVHIIIYRRSIDEYWLCEVNIRLETILINTDSRGTNQLIQYDSQKYVFIGKPICSYWINIYEVFHIYMCVCAWRLILTCISL